VGAAEAGAAVVGVVAISAKGFRHRKEMTPPAGRGIPRASAGSASVVWPKGR